MKIAFIKSRGKLKTGAYFINDLISKKLKECNIGVQDFYPKPAVKNVSVKLKGIRNVLSFYSLIEKKKNILKCDIIQGTTYTPLAFLNFSKPVISHFGSTTAGFLRAVPRTTDIEKDCAKIFRRLKRDGAINEIGYKSRKPLEDVAKAEIFSARHADKVIATSQIVKEELLGMKVLPERVHVIHNAIEDFWFEAPRGKMKPAPHIVFLGRIGEDCFTLKLKGIARLICILKNFEKIPKLTIAMSTNKPLLSWLRDSIQRHIVMDNVPRKNIPSLLEKHAGGVALMTSRYEGFSLSLIEMMSQRLAPVCFPVGIAPEIIKNGKNGFIVNSIEEAVDKIHLLLDNNSLRHKMAFNAANTVKRFKADFLIEKTVSLYGKLLKQ